MKTKSKLGYQCPKCKVWLTSPKQRHPCKRLKKSIGWVNEFFTNINNEKN